MCEPCLLTRNLITFHLVLQTASPRNPTPTNLYNHYTDRLLHNYYTPTNVHTSYACSNSVMSLSAPRLRSTRVPRGSASARCYKDIELILSYCMASTFKHNIKHAPEEAHDTKMKHAYSENTISLLYKTTEYLTVML